MPTRPYQQRSLNAALGLFLDLGSNTALHRAETVSSSVYQRGTLALHALRAAVGGSAGAAAFAGGGGVI